MKKAFTLTELLVALAVVGVLTAILFPIVYNLMPDQNLMMAKRAYYALQGGVSDLINDDSCYPDLTYTEDRKRIGFDDDSPYDTCDDYTTEDTSTTTNKYVNKFGALLSSRLDTELNDDDEPVTCDLGDANAYTFKTKDGICWSLTADSAGTTYDKDHNKIILKLDLNGVEDSDKPNCYGKVGGAEKYDTTDACKNRTKGYDRFSVVIRADGQLKIQEDWAKEAVTVTKKITGD